MSPVLITVFDGLQPAQVTPALMPNLARFASEGVTFANHHPVYPSVTRINAASMVTGRYPGAHGLAANTLVVREMDPHVAFSALEPTLTRLKERTGRVLLAPTLADLLARHGMEYVAIGTGTTGNAFVHNPNADESGGATIHPEFTLPRGLYGELEARFGEWPPEAMPAVDRLARAVDVMTDYILPNAAPRSRSSGFRSRTTPSTPTAWAALRACVRLARQTSSSDGCWRGWRPRGALPTST